MSLKSIRALFSDCPSSHVFKDGRGCDYIPWQLQCDEMNLLFGQHMWTLEVYHETLKCLHCEPGCVAYGVHGKLTVDTPEGQTMTKHGYGADVSYLKDMGAAHVVASMGAHSIMMKRCAVQLGRRMGLERYGGGDPRKELSRSKPLWIQEMEEREASMESLISSLPDTDKTV